MKKITITKALRATDIGDENPKLTGFEIEGGEEMDASDGYHTFKELYDHRIALFIAFCRLMFRKVEEDADHRIVWRSKLHSDGSAYDGWFIMGLYKEPGQQISYHLPISRWEETNFAEILERAPEWDGHKPEDVTRRLLRINV